MAVELACPACGALVEAPGADELVVRSKEHTNDAHGYDVPEQHVRQAAVDVGDA